MYCFTSNNVMILCFQDFPRGVKVDGHIIMDIHGLLRETTYYLQIGVSIPDTMETKWPNTLPSSDTFVVTTVENKRKLFFLLNPWHKGIILKHCFVRFYFCMG